MDKDKRDSLPVGSAGSVMYAGEKIGDLGYYNQEPISFASDPEHLNRVRQLEVALTWYAEQAEGCRKFTQEGDAARQALDADGGKRARTALQPNPVPGCAPAVTAGPATRTPAIPTNKTPAGRVGVGR